MDIKKIILDRLNKADNKNPLKVAYTNGLRYYKDFIDMLERFKLNLTDKEVKEIIDKLQLDKKFDEQQYFQSVSEITVLYYILRKYNNNFIYEPKYNGNKNPECSFKYLNKTINVEVKCPNLSKRIEQERNDKLKLELPERIPNHGEVIEDVINIVEPCLMDSRYSGVEEKKRLDNKLKVYLESASKKFPETDDKYFNILVISLEIIPDLDEWYLYLFGDDGVFTNNSYVTCDYSNVDAILLTTPVCGHKGDPKFKEINTWNLEETINLLFLNPKKQESDNGKFYFKNAWKIFGDLIYNFNEYLKMLDQQSKEEWQEIEHNEDLKAAKRTEQKLIQSQIVTNFFEKMERQ